VAATVLRSMPPVYRAVASFGSPASRGQRLRAAGRTVKFDIRTRLLKHPTTAAIGDHSKIIAYPGETNSPHAAYRNPPNWEMLVWRRYLRPGDLFVDVGANIGIYTIYMLDLGARVIAFEPDRHNADRIRENVRLNGYTAEVIQKAVSDRPGVVRFTEGLDSYNHLVLSGTEGVEVDATTLDAALGGQVVHGLKVDVEGAERLVLEGASSALAEHRIKLLQLEWTAAEVHATLHEDRSPAADLLRDHGYGFYRPDRRQAHLHKITGPVPTGTDVFASAEELCP
jgi:FkbM family methyltransferase